MTGSVNSHTLIAAAAYLGAGIIGALVLRGVLARLYRRAEQTRWRGGDIVVAFLRLVAPWCLGVGFAWAAVLALPLRSTYRYDLDHALLAVIVVVVSLGSAKVAGAAVRAGATSHAGTSGSATIFVSITQVIVWTIGGLVLLDSLGVAITPLLTALGVGGLAVALALQDTLSNLFAGVHILASRKVQPGDFILEQVERVTIEVGQEVMQEVNGAVTEHEPTVRYNTFGGSGISFNVGLRAADISAQALITHEFIKRLHSRYQKEGISNSSPAETIVYTGAEAPASAAVAGH